MASSRSQSDITPWRHCWKKAKRTKSLEKLSPDLGVGVDTWAPEQESMAGRASFIFSKNFDFAVIELTTVF